jgi:hypothetical protein
MVVPLTLTARGGWPQLSFEILLQGLLKGAGSTGGGLDAQLLKEADRAMAHPPRQHDINIVSFDKGGHLPVGVAANMRVGDDLNRLWLLAIKVYKSKIRAAAKMKGYLALKAVVLLY